MATDDDEQQELLAAAGDHTEADAPLDVERCPACGHALDDVEKMTNEQVLDHLQQELHRDLLRDLRRGMLTHQEKAIVRGILRDNKRMVDSGEEDDSKRSSRRGPGGRELPPRERYDSFPEDYSDTDGG